MLNAGCWLLVAGCCFWAWMTFALCHAMCWLSHWSHWSKWGEEWRLRAVVTVGPEQQEKLQPQQQEKQKPSATLKVDVLVTNKNRLLFEFYDECRSCLIIGSEENHLVGLQTSVVINKSGPITSSWMWWMWWSWWIQWRAPLALHR